MAKAKRKSAYNPEHDQRLRALAIGHAVAISCAAGGHDVEPTVKMASVFLDFLTGKAPKTA